MTVFSAGSDIKAFKWTQTGRPTRLLLLQICLLLNFNTSECLAPVLISFAVVFVAASL